MRKTRGVSDPDTQRARFRLRSLAAAVAALIPAIPIVIALLLSSGGARAGTTTTTTARALFVPVPATKAPPQNLLLPPGNGALVALLAHGTVMRSAPGGRVFAKLATRTGFGSPQAFWVVRLSGDWLGVVSPQAGNGKVGWIPASAASLTRVDWELKVSLSHRELTVLENGTVRERYPVAIGKPSAPTPTGRFAVTDRLNTGNPGGPYGCCILALSAVAPHAIQGWSGGNRIAIHSTPDTSTIGQAISHGCVHVNLAQGRWLLNHIPIGTPTLVTG